MQNNELVFPSNAKSASHKNLDRYSYHVYGGIGYFYSVIYMKLAQQVPSAAFLKLCNEIGELPKKCVCWELHAAVAHGASAALWRQCRHINIRWTTIKW